MVFFSPVILLLGIVLIAGVVIALKSMSGSGRAAEPPAAAGVTLSCPHCGQETDAAQALCRHCGKDL